LPGAVRARPLERDPVDARGSLSPAGPVVRRPIVGVMGSGAERHDALAAPVGRWLAQQGVHLLTGGGGGVMEAVSEAFAQVPERQGLVLGILKGFPARAARGQRATTHRLV